MKRCVNSTRRAPFGGRRFNWTTPGSSGTSARKLTPISIGLSRPHCERWGAWTNECGTGQDENQEKPRPCSKGRGPAGNSCSCAFDRDSDGLEGCHHPGGGTEASLHVALVVRTFSRQA